MDTFTDTFGLAVEHSQFQSSSRDFAPRLLQELKAGLHTFDVAMMPEPEMLRQIRGADGLEPIRSALVHPDILGDKNWYDGFDGGFLDADKKWGYCVTRGHTVSMWVNSDMVKDGEIKSVKDLLAPKWKGNILAGDPRTKGSAFQAATVMRIKSGSDDIIKQFYRDQEPTLGTDARQLTEFMVRGRFPVSIGAVSIPILRDFQAEGVGLNLKSVPLPDVDFVQSGSNVVWLMKAAPHQSAAKLYINWLLQKEGSAIWSKAAEDNSRRNDVPPFDAESAPSTDYLLTDSEAILPEIEKTQTIAKDVLN